MEIGLQLVVWFVTLMVIGFMVVFPKKMQAFKK
ncbi:hypothetical protein Gohar_017259 [Gossypium harknessii]|uniref:Uncharacterized protein n=1 Tax=Gossypium harknessii TaxID=34285 RepID=A0A7J9G5Q5_9ROSI|nr:hypothetical protein [Gossypium harknessii]